MADNGTVQLVTPTISVECAENGAVAAAGKDRESSGSKRHSLYSTSGRSRQTSTSGFHRTASAAGRLESQLTSSEECITPVPEDRSDPGGPISKKLKSPRVPHSKHSSADEGPSMVEKGTSGDRTPEMPERAHTGHKGNRSNGKNSKKSSNWYNMLHPTYKSKCEDFHKLFKHLPETERLLVDYSCALQKDILVHGRLYLTENWVCFYANIFRWETLLTIRCKDITSITKEKTAKVIPNAIQICTENEKHFLTSFTQRDSVYMMIFRIWQNALLEKPLSPSELWQYFKLTNGEMDFSSEEEDSATDSKSTEDLSAKKGEGSTGSRTPQRSASPIPSPASSEPSRLSSVESPMSDDPPSLPVGRSSPTTPQSTSEQADISQADTVADETLPQDSMKDDYISTEESDTSETEDDDVGEVVCPYNDLVGRKCINEVYNIPVDKLYEMLFSQESDFFQEFHASRKTFDMVIGPWQDREDGDQTRQLTYTLTLNASFGPKTSASTETQISHDMKPGLFYVVDCEIVNGGIPYGENFYVLNRYCLNRVTSYQSRLRVSSEIKYRKTVWGLVKNIIEKNAGHGIQENFKHLGRHLDKVSDACQPPTPRKNKGLASSVRRRKRASSYTYQPRPPEISITGPQSAAAPNPSLASMAPTLTRAETREDLSPSQPWPIDVDAHKCLLAICIILVCLLLLNLLVMYRVWSLERATSSLQPWPAKDVSWDSTTPRSPEEWIQLLQQQQQFHEAELRRWREVLATSVTLLDQMRASLSGLSHDVKTKVDNPVTAESPAHSDDF
ncbi:PREDICTED: GRAM domain-containing protein 1B-like isoform X3 [Branchiostoma belcheri]|uniref:GRAM domain-containing protein 1B-like isoform X3 n=1 Tax=Branchiostoma belcheri TaxID=7741 RepID=A0A6P4YSP2_BRABE|nr:PREDICTED: GRAM domain-containing protein 1B-like isoform X3 [Branchiostoma belcheri]